MPASRLNGECKTWFAPGTFGLWEGYLMKFNRVGCLDWKAMTLRHLFYTPSAPPTKASWGKCVLLLLIAESRNFDDGVFWISISENRFFVQRTEVTSEQRILEFFAFSTSRRRHVRHHRWADETLPLGKCYQRLPECLVMFGFDAYLNLYIMGSDLGRRRFGL